jgi:hypothetical protein
MLLLRVDALLHDRGRQTADAHAALEPAASLFLDVSDLLAVNGGP